MTDVEKKILEMALADPNLARLFKGLTKSQPEEESTNKHEPYENEGKNTKLGIANIMQYLGQKKLAWFNDSEIKPCECGRSDCKKNSVGRALFHPKWPTVDNLLDLREHYVEKDTKMDITLMGGMNNKEYHNDEWKLTALGTEEVDINLDENIKDNNYTDTVYFEAEITIHEGGWFMSIDKDLEYSGPLLYNLTTEIELRFSDKAFMDLLNELEQAVKEDEDDVLLNGRQEQVKISPY